MKIKTIATLCLMSLSLSGCATLEQMHQDWLKRNCNPESAYNRGLTDGLTPGTLPDNYPESCPVRSAAINKAYLKGFGKGLKSRPQEVNVTKNKHATESLFSVTL